MEGKFAVLEYSKDYSHLTSDSILLKTGISALRERHIRKRLPYRASDLSVLGTKGLKIQLPITDWDACENTQLKNHILQGVLGILREQGVRAVKAQFPYEYDFIIPAASGFYVLPFLLPIYLKKCSKIADKHLSAIEALIIDGISDLTIDALCVLSAEINRITVLTENVALFDSAAQSFLLDSGLNINITNRKNDSSIRTADVILNASATRCDLVNHYKKSAFLLDMAGNKKMLSDISARRTDIVAADGFELKKDGQYLDTLLLETVLLSGNQAFEKYVFGKCRDKDFYSILNLIEDQGFVITSFLRDGITPPIKCCR